MTLSLQSGLTFVIPTLMQTILTATAAIRASQTSMLKQRWMSGAKWHELIGPTIIVAAVLYVLSNGFICIARSSEVLGFRSVESGREMILVSYWANLVLVPFVSLATVTRMPRRLNRARKANEEILSKKTGILEPETVHHQTLKVHFNDVQAKAQMLHYVQQMQIMEAASGTMKPDALVEKLRPDLQPSDVFSAGMLRSDESAISWFGLMAKLLHMRGTQLKRFCTQLAVFIIHVSICIAKYYKPTGDSYAENILYGITFSCFLCCSSILGLWYEQWALDLASPHDSGNKVKIVASWVAVQVSFLSYPFYTLHYGFYFGHVLYVQIITWLTWFGWVHEWLVSEAWISLQEGERECFNVPSWIDLEKMLREKADGETL